MSRVLDEDMAIATGQKHSDVRPSRADLPAELNAARPRHHYVAEHDVEFAVGFEPLYGRPCVWRQLGAIAEIM